MTQIKLKLKRALAYMLALALAFTLLPALALADSGAVVTDEVSFDVLLNVDSSYGVDPNELADKISVYLDQLISSGNEDKTYRINTTAAQIDPTDLTKWHVYDHYDPAWYANETAWNNNYASDRGLTPSVLPSNWFYYGMTDGSSGGNNSVTINDGVAGKLTLDQMYLGVNGIKYGTTGLTAKLREHIFAYTDTVSKKPAMVFYGYGVSKYADFLYYPASATSTKSVSFDVDAGEVLPHSLRYAGFLINAGVDESGKIHGYLLLLSYGVVNSKVPATTLTGTYLVKLDGVNASTLHEFGLRGNTTNNDSTFITNASMTNLNYTQAANNFWKKSHLELEITPTSIKATMQELDASGNLKGSPVEIANVAVDDTGFGGFGPYVDYGVAGHTCTSTASFKFSNLAMSFIEPLTGSSTLEAYKYADYLKKSDQTFFINLTSSNADEDKYSATAKSEDEAYLYLIQRDETVLITDRTLADGGSGTDPIFPEAEMENNCKDVTNISDVSDSDLAAYGLEPGEDPIEILAAKLAWLIYHTSYEETGSEATPPAGMVIADIKLMDASERDANQINQIRRELIDADTANGQLKVYLDSSGSVGARPGYDPVYTITDTEGNSFQINLEYDDSDEAREHPYFIVENDGVDWPAGEYKFQLAYDTSGDVGVISIPSQITTLRILTDTTPPAVTANVGAPASGSIPLKLTFNNIQSSGDYTYTSALASYAFIVNQSSTRPATPGDSDRTDISAGKTSEDANILSSVTGTGEYYVHAFLWDAAGNVGYNSSSFTITELPQALEGTEVIYLEIGRDSALLLDIVNKTVGGSAVSYSISSGGDLIDLDDGAVTPLKYGTAVIEATAGAVTIGGIPYSSAALTIYVHVLDPLTVQLAITDYDSAGVTVVPTNTEGGYGINDASRVLKYRKAGDTAWTVVDTGSWSWDNGYILDFSGLSPDTQYEVCVSAEDNRPTDASYSEASVIFRTPPDGGTVPGGGGSAAIVVQDPGGGDLPQGDYTIVIKDGDAVIAVVPHYENGDANSFSELISGLPDGNYTVEVIGPSGSKTTDSITILDGNQAGGPLELNIGEYIKNTKLTVSSDTPRVTASGLNAIYDYFKSNAAGDDSDGLTAQDNTDSETTGSVSLIELKAKAIPENTTGSLAGDISKLRAAATGRIAALYLDLTLWKTITLDGQLPQSPTQLTQSGTLLTITVPLTGMNGDNFKIYRVHGDNPADEIPEGAANATAGGEYCEFVGTSAAILHVKYFSLYSFTYVPASTPPSPPSPSTGSTIDAKAGDGGTITSPGTSNVKPGEEITYIITPDYGYFIYDVLVDGVSVGAHESWTFTDVDKNHTIEVIFKQIIGLNLKDHYAYVIGYPDGNVHPEFYITREEIATIFFRLLEPSAREKYLSYENPFTDVAEGRWSNCAISTLTNAGILNGRTADTFDPRGNISRAELAAIAARFEAVIHESGLRFSDVAGHWAEPEIYSAVAHGWVVGYGDGTFRPNQLLTRAETMTLINRVLNRVPESPDDLLEDMTVWPDNADKTVWYYLAVQEATNSHYYARKDGGVYEQWTEIRESYDWTQW